MNMRQTAVCGNRRKCTAENGQKQEMFFRDSQKRQKRSSGNFFYCALRISEAEELCDVDGEDISGATQDVS